jgi:hypothetical protein
MSYFYEFERDLEEEAVLSRALANGKDCGGGNDKALEDLMDSLVTECQSENMTVVQPSIDLRVSVASSSASVNSYSFPVECIDANHLVFDNLAKRMSELVESWRKHGDYMQIRDEYCELAIALNYEGLLAPAYREMPKNPPPGSTWEPINLLLHQDRVVIECHWLRCRHELVLTRDNKYQALFDVTVPFHFDLAASFASEGWKSNHRTDEALYLTTWQQCQLIALQGAEVRERRETIPSVPKHGPKPWHSKIFYVRRALREWCRSDRRIIAEQKAYENLWFARELIGKGGTMIEIAKLGGFISGVCSLNESTVRSKLKRLDKHMAGGM